MLGQRIREGTAREIAYAAASAKPVTAVLEGYTEHVTRGLKNLLIIRILGSSGCTPKVLPQQVQRAALIKHKDLYPLRVCIPKFSAQRHSTLIGLQSLSSYLTNDNTVN